METWLYLHNVLTDFEEIWHCDIRYHLVIVFNIIVSVSLPLLVNKASCVHLFSTEPISQKIGNFKIQEPVAAVLKSQEITISSRRID